MNLLYVNFYHIQTYSTNINIWTFNFKIHDFWCPTKLTDVDGTIHRFKLPENEHEDDYNFKNSNGLHYEAEEVRKCIMNGKLESDYVSHSDSIIIANISDEIRKQIGVNYPEDVQEF